MQTANIESQSVANCGRKKLRERAEGSAKKAEGKIIFFDALTTIVKWRRKTVQNEGEEKTTADNSSASVPQ